MRPVHLCLLAASALACNPDKGDTSTDAATTTTTTQPATTSTSDDETSSTAPTSTRGTDTSSTADPSTSTTDDTTTGTADACSVLCAHLDQCQHDDAIDCPETCPASVAFYAYPGPGCTALYEQYLACLTAATCDELADPGACEQFLDALIVDACTSDLCDQRSDHLIECGLIEEDGRIFTAFECTTALAEAYADIGEACGAASEVQTACFTALPCDQINNPAENCQTEQADQDAACM